MFAPTQRATITSCGDPIVICCDASSCAPVRVLGVCFGAWGIGKRQQSALLFDGRERVLGEAGFGSTEVKDPFGFNEPTDVIPGAGEVLVYYAHDSFDITMDFDAELENLVIRLSEDPEAIKRRLLQQYSVNPEQIELIGFCEDRPREDAPEEQAQNRRAVVLVE